jgi:hypothetical protein
MLYGHPKVQRRAPEGAKILHFVKIKTGVSEQ